MIDWPSFVQGGITALLIVGTIVLQAARNLFGDDDDDQWFR